MDYSKREAQLKEEKDFHKSRVAFLIVDDKIEFLENSEKSHYTWAREDFGITDNKAFDNMVRGFYKDGRAIFYKGNFGYDKECIERAKEFGDIIKTKMGVKKLEVWCGLHVGKIGEIWKPDFCVNIIDGLDI